MSIAIKFGLTVPQLRQINRKSLQVVHPGQIIYVKKPQGKTPLSSPTKKVGTRESDFTLLDHLREKYERHYVNEHYSSQPLSLPSLSDNSDIFKHMAWIVQQQISIAGTLTIAPELFLYEPFPDDPGKEALAPLSYQFTCYPSEIQDARILKLTYLERVSLGIGNARTENNNQHFLQLCIKTERNSQPDTDIVYFIINESELVELDAILHRVLPPGIYHPDANKKKSARLRYGVIAVDKIFGPDHPEENENDWEYQPELIGQSFILKGDDVATIDSFLPSRSKMRDWELIFCTSTDGVSMQTFYTKTDEINPSLLLVEDSMGGVFGAYVSEAWVKQKGFYGTGETFLFKLRPEEKRGSWKWTEKNNFFMYSVDDAIAVGGGRGTYGLWLGNEWSEGLSDTCDTFQNPPLSTSSSRFTVRCVEIWRFT
jgi:hypothetical protein